MAVSGFEFLGNAELTTREVITDQVSAVWMADHPDVVVTEANLSKTLQELFTEIFQTRGSRQRQPLSAHAEELLYRVGLCPADFAPARSFAKSADMPVEYGTMFGRLAQELAPLACAVQLARIPVTNAAAALTDPAESIDRRQLRGFVVAHVRPYAQEVHARVGAGKSVHEYLRLILADVDRVAAAVVASARSKNARPTRLDGAAADRAAMYARAHLNGLRGYATQKFGQNADDIVGAAMLKLSAQFRNDPGLSIGFAYGRKVIDNAAKDLFAAQQVRRDREQCDSDLLERAEGVTDDIPAVDGGDVVVRMVLSAVAQLADAGPDRDAEAAREALLRYFLVDPQEVEPRKARLAERALGLVESDGRHGIGAELSELAAAVGAEGVHVQRATALALAALRAQCFGGGSVRAA